MADSVFMSLEQMNEKHGLNLRIGAHVTVSGRQAVLKRVHAEGYVEVRFDDTGERATLPVAQLVTNNP
jgi:hypothetical protein